MLFLRLLGLGSRKIGAFLWGFFVAEDGEAGISEGASSLSSVFEGVIRFGSPAVDKICLLELSLLVGVMELRVCPQRIQENRGSFTGFVGGTGIPCTDGHDFLQAPSV